jgi:hydrogenase-4 component F
VFASELGMARAGAAAGMGWAMAAAFVLVLLAFAALTAGTARMLLGPATPVGDGGGPGRFTAATAAPLLTGLVLVVSLGITTAPLINLLQGAAAIVGTP